MADFDPFSDDAVSSEETALLIELSSSDTVTSVERSVFGNRNERVEAVEDQKVVVSLSSSDSVTAIDRHLISRPVPVLEVEVVAFAPTWHTTLPIETLEIEITVGIPTFKITYGDAGQLQPPGFEVRVLMAPSYTTVLAVIGEWTDLSFSIELNDLGAGSISMDLDSEFWLATLPGGYSPYKLLDEEHLWEIWDNGVLRFQFFGTTVREQVAEESLSQEVSVSGPGTAEVLNWGLVYPPGFPVSTAQTWVFNPTPGASSISVMNGWLQLLNAAKARGTLTLLTPTFTATTDSEGGTWLDIGQAGTWEPDIGTTLLEALVEASGQEKEIAKTSLVVDWIMRPNFKLDVASIIGEHKEDRVIFFDNKSTRTRARTRDRSDVGNYVGVLAANNAASVVSSASSISRYNQREVLVTDPNQIDSTTRLNLAQAQLDQSKDERSDWTIRVQYGATGTMPFVDFSVGDWVGIERYTPVALDPLTDTMSGGTSAVEVFRVLAITIRVNEDGETDMELTLDNKISSWRKEITKKVTKVTNSVNTVKIKG